MEGFKEEIYNSNMDFRNHEVPAVFPETLAREPVGICMEKSYETLQPIVIVFGILGWNIICIGSCWKIAAGDEFVHLIETHLKYCLLARDLFNIRKNRTLMTPWIV